MTGMRSAAKFDSSFFFFLSSGFIQSEKRGKSSSIQLNHLVSAEAED